MATDDITKELELRSQAPDLKVYWLPGCSSCVKVKEHLNRLGVPFESVNVAAHPRSMDDLLALGVRSVPVVTRGSEYVFAQSLDAVTAFVGRLEPVQRRQDPDFYFKKWIRLLNVAISYLECAPETILRIRVISERDRAIGELAYHVFQIPAAFVHCMKNDDPDWLSLSSGPVDVGVAMTKECLVEYAGKATRELESYWGNGESEFRVRSMDLDMNLKSSIELLDRCSWHSAQHLRQVAHALTREGVLLSPTWSDTLYEGLSVPKQLWE